MVIALQSKPFSSTQSDSFGKSSLAWSWSPRIVGSANRACLAQGANPAIQEIVQFGHLKHPTILNNSKSEFIYIYYNYNVCHSETSFLNQVCAFVGQWRRAFNPVLQTIFQSEKASRWFQFHVSRSRWCPDLWDELRASFWTEERTVIVFIGHVEQLNKLIGRFLSDFQRDPKKLISLAANCCFALLFWDSYLRQK